MQATNVRKATRYKDTGGKGPSSGKIAKVAVFGRWLVSCKLRFFNLLVLGKGVIPAVAVPPRAREKEFIAQMVRKSVISGVVHGRCKSRACGRGST
jgi:hypothetical protein